MLRRRAARSSTRLVRLSRRTTRTLLLGTQRIADLGGLAELIGVVFVFGRTATPPPPRHSGLIGLEATPDMSRQRSVISGRALPDARPARPCRGRFTIDLVYRRLLQRSDHTPATPKERHENRDLSGAEIGQSDGGGGSLSCSRALLLVLLLAMRVALASDVIGDIGPAPQAPAGRWPDATPSNTALWTSLRRDLGRVRKRESTPPA